MRPQETGSGQRPKKADSATDADSASHVVSRRSFLQGSALAGAGAALTAWSSASAQQIEDALSVENHGGREIAYASIADLQSRMASGRLTSRELVEIYLQRIRFFDEKLDLRSVLQLNPDARRIASELDRERRHQGARGPLHGIPILIKDNIATADHMQTTAGSLALIGHKPPRDAHLVARLREAGAVILGKTNLSEWANFRGERSISGWSGRGGQTRNPYVLDRNPSGSSSGEIRSGRMPSQTMMNARVAALTL